MDENHNFINKMLILNDNNKTRPLSIISTYNKSPITHPYSANNITLYDITTPTQVFSCEYCEFFESSFFAEHVRCLLSFFNLWIFNLCIGHINRSTGICFDNSVRGWRLIVKMLVHLESSGYRSQLFTYFWVGKHWLFCFLIWTWERSTANSLWLILHTLFQYVDVVC